MNEWVWGYVTAVNQFAPHSNNGNIQGASDAQSLVAWISNYCAQNPLDPLATAEGRLILELRRRAHDEESGQ